MQLELCLLGAYHDRRIWLTYQHVTSYHLNAPQETKQPVLDWQGRTTGIIALTHESGHGDLSVHEVRLSDTGSVIHELHFTHGSTLMVECDDIVHREERFGNKQRWI